MALHPKGPKLAGEQASKAEDIDKIAGAGTGYRELKKLVTNLSFH